MTSLYQEGRVGNHTHLNRFPPGWLLGMPGFGGPCLAYVPHLSAPQGQRSIVLVLLQCDLPSVDKGFQLGLFLLSFNLLPVTDGTKTRKKKKKNPWRQRNWCLLYGSSAATHRRRLAGVAEELQPFGIILPLIVSKIHKSRGATQSCCIIQTFLTHCLYCFTQHKSRTLRYK